MFHYFNESVRIHSRDRLTVLLSGELTRDLIESIEQGTVPDVVVRDFTDEVISVGDPRRVFRALLLLSPITGAVFLCSALLGSLEEIMAKATSTTVEVVGLGAYVLLFFGMSLAIWTAINVAKLARELS